MYDEDEDEFIDVAFDGTFHAGLIEHLQFASQKMGCRISAATASLCLSGRIPLTAFDLRDALISLTEETIRDRYEIMEKWEQDNEGKSAFSD